MATIAFVTTLAAIAAIGYGYVEFIDRRARSASAIGHAGTEKGEIVPEGADAVLRVMQLLGDSHLWAETPQDSPLDIGGALSQWTGLRADASAAGVSPVLLHDLDQHLRLVGRLDEVRAAALGDSSGDLDAASLDLSCRIADRSPVLVGRVARHLAVSGSSPSETRLQPDAA